MKYQKLIFARSAARRRHGFTLVEAAMVTVVIGVGVVAILQLMATGTIANATGSGMTTGLNLANNLRELMQSVRFADSTAPTHWGAESGETTATYDDLDDFDGQTISPPIDARRQSISAFANWSQTVTVQSVDKDRLTLVVPHGSLLPEDRPMSLVTVTVGQHGKTVCQISWLAVYTK